VEQDGTATSREPANCLITADGGGSNSHRSRLWKLSLQQLADDLEFEALRLPFATGTEQVDKDRASIVQFHHAKLAWAALGQSPGHRHLIGSTTTRAGLLVKPRWTPTNMTPRSKSATNNLLA